MAVYRHGSLSGPECPWCPEQMRHTTDDDAGRAHYACRNGHYLSVESDDVDEGDDEW